MSQSPDDVSRDTLERLVARAIELDNRNTDRISLARAKEIARDLGISEAAWDTAVAERAPQRTAAMRARSVWTTHVRTLLTAGAGFAAGGLGGWLNAAFNGDVDVVFGASLVVGGLVLWARAREECPEVAQTRLDAWWVAIPAGMLVTFGEVRTDPLLFAAFARWGTGWVTAHLPGLRRLLREPQQPASTSTA